jgi:hypothetical protein
MRRPRDGGASVHGDPEHHEADDPDSDRAGLDAVTQYN